MGQHSIHFSCYYHLHDLYYYYPDPIAPHSLKDGSLHCPDEELRPGKAFQENLPPPPPPGLGQSGPTPVLPASAPQSSWFWRCLINKHNRALLELPLTRQSLESNLLLMCWGRLGAASVMARLSHLPPARGCQEGARASKERPSRV